MTDDKTEVAPVTFETLEVHPSGSGLDGHVLQMRRPSVRFLIVQRRGAAGDPEYWEEIIDAIVAHDLGIEPDRLTAQQVEAIGLAWIQAMKDAAIPPASGTD